MNSEKKLFLIRGLPGSGKSTFAKILAGLGSDFLICEADKYFIDSDGEYKFDASKIKEAHESCRETVETYMKDSMVRSEWYKEIIVSNTFTQEWEMQPYFDLAEKYGYSVFCIVVENRHGGKNVHNVPEEKIEKMRRRFEFKL